MIRHAGSANPPARPWIAAHDHVKVGNANIWKFKKHEIGVCTAGAEATLSCKSTSSENLIAQAFAAPALIRRMSPSSTTYSFPFVITFPFAFTAASSPSSFITPKLYTIA